MSGVSKQQIVNEIRRTAEVNGGVPLGRSRFAQETGIKDSDWFGKFWAKWGDALQEAGFQPNKLQTAFSDDYLIEKFVSLMRSLGHFPLNAEVRMKARNDGRFPSHNTFARFDSRKNFVDKILNYCDGRDDLEDIVGFCMQITTQGDQHDNSPSPDSALPVDPNITVKAGYVYMALLKIGREKRYKIGKAVLVERRADQISIQLPEDLELVHSIRTDDAYGIEGYWHKRFAAKHTKGEWFSLTREDVEAFKRRKFM